MFSDPVVARLAMDRVKRTIGELNDLLVDLEPIAPDRNGGNADMRSGM